MNAIQRKRAQIERRLTTAQNDLAILRTQCPHADVSRIPNSNTGNWSPSDDRYWNDCVCLDCGKRWAEDQ
jgi:hypothetical protein